MVGGRARYFRHNALEPELCPLTRWLLKNGSAPTTSALIFSSSTLANAASISASLSALRMRTSQLSARAASSTARD